MDRPLGPGGKLGPDPTSVFLESLPGLFFVYGSDGRLIRWNRNHSLLTGYSTEELEGMHFLDYFRPELHADVQQAVENVLSRGFSMAEFSLRKKDGSEVPFLFTARRIEVDGQPGFCGHGIDISERKELETRLRHAEKLEAVGNVAGGIAHDFNNVLTTVLGNTEIALSEPGLSQATRLALEEIQLAAEKARELVGQIVDFSRRNVREESDLVLQEQIDGLAFLLRASVPRSVDLKFDLPAEPIVVHTNASQIHQVLLNLCTNSGHAIGDQPGLIEVALTRTTLDASDHRVRAGELAAGRYAVVEVRDDGPGIPADRIPLIFEPYFTTKPTGEGAGVGLSVVRNVARENGGSVAVESKPGEGTIVRVLLPEAASTPPPPAAE
jgi:PAS domain S-box-containing protein